VDGRQCQANPSDVLADHFGMADELFATFPKAPTFIAPRNGATPLK